jgi:hypothetical protein
MFNRFCEAQNLCALFCAEKLPSELRELIPEYKHAFEGDIRGTLVNDMLAYDEHFNSRHAEVTWSERDLTPLSPSIHRLLQEWYAIRVPNLELPKVQPEAFQRTYITRLGETFVTASASARDSLVVYQSHNKER